MRFHCEESRDALIDLRALCPEERDEAQPMACSFSGFWQSLFGYGRQLGLDFPATAARLEAEGQRGPSAAQAASSLSVASVRGLGNGDQRQRIRESAIGMIYTSSYGVMAGVLRDQALKPDAVIGYSLGRQRDRLRVHGLTNRP